MRCDEFYQKWKKHPNFCEKSPESVRLIDFYLSTVDEVVTQDLDESAVYVGLSERAARPLFKEKDPKVRAIVIANIAGMIKRGQKVSAADVTTWIEAANPTMVGTRSPEPAVKPAPAPIPPGDLPFEKSCRTGARNCPGETYPPLNPSLHPPRLHPHNEHWLHPHPIRTSSGIPLRLTGRIRWHSGRWFSEASRKMMTRRSSPVLRKDSPCSWTETEDQEALDS